ncbi:MAG: MFS transporter [Cyclobacteriaceae bacterium]
MLALIFGSVVVNYLDRSNISVAASELSDALELSSVQMGAIFSAFGVTYALLQIPGGLIVDRVKARVLYSSILVLWSVATLAQGFVSSFRWLIGLRASIGVFESPSYPCNNAIVTRWFPENERASAIAIYTSGQFVGLAFLIPVLTWIQTVVGWRGLFIVSGVIGILWAVVWYIFYRDPSDHKGINQGELDHLEKGGAIVEDTQTSKEKMKFKWADLAEVLVHRKLWGLYIGQFCMGSTSIFFLTWFPTYLVKYRGLDFLQSGFLASIPFIAAFIGILLSGFTSDFLIRKGVSREISRKAPVLGGLLLSMIILGANYTDSTALVITFLALAFFGNGFASIGWVFVSSLAPKRLIGLVGGTFNLIGGTTAFIIPMTIGYLVEDGDFAPALFFIASLTAIGFFSYLFLVGKVERIEEKLNKA